MQPGRKGEFRAAVDQALQLALTTGCQRIHLLSGVGPSLAERLELLCANLAYAAAQFASHGITALVEPINPRDIPGYLLNTQAQAFAVLQRSTCRTLPMCKLRACRIGMSQTGTSCTIRIAAPVGWVASTGYGQAL